MVILCTIQMLSALSAKELPYKDISQWVLYLCDDPFFILYLKEKQDPRAVIAGTNVRRDAVHCEFLYTATKYESKN